MAVDLEWWKEFIRVETDKFLLVFLVAVFLRHDPGGKLDMVLGALLMAIQNNRYARAPYTPPAKGASDASKV